MADEVWLLRHAETEWSRTGRHTGRTDIPLTDEGRRVAQALRPRLEGHAFALVLCSPLMRARETASLAGLECSGLRDDLLEWDYGEYEGITTPQIREQRPDWYLWTDGAPGGESPDEVAARCDRVTLTLPKLNASHRILLVVTGAEKAPMLARVIAGPDPDVPASLLDRGRLEIVADAAALDG